MREETRPKIDIRSSLRSRKPLPDPEPGRHHPNELDRLRRQMRLRDLTEMCRKLEQVKLTAKTSQEVIITLEDIRENLEYIEAEVRRLSSLSLHAVLFV